MANMALGLRLYHRLLVWHAHDNDSAVFSCFHLDKDLLQTVLVWMEMCFLNKGAKNPDFKYTCVSVN